jgi:predicted component of type VI protein secretion system
MNLRASKRIFLLVALYVIAGCTSSESPKVKLLEKGIAAAEATLTGIEQALKTTPKANQGLVIKLNQDKQLAESRLERLKENLYLIDPKKKLQQKASPEGGGGGH